MNWELIRNNKPLSMNSFKQLAGRTDSFSNLIIYI